MHTALFSLQNSRDNMSVILVTFPNAPQISETAIKKVYICARLLRALVELPVKIGCTIVGVQAMRERERVYILCTSCTCTYI